MYQWNEEKYATKAELVKAIEQYLADRLADGDLGTVAVDGRNIGLFIKVEIDE